MKERQMRERIFSDPGEAKKILNEYGENAPNWLYREEKFDLDRMAGLLKDNLIDPILLLHRLQMPDVVVGFDDAGNQNILAFYRKVPNAHGIPDEVIFNNVHYETTNGKVSWRYGKWSQYETLAHEMGHGLLNYISKIENRSIPAHGKEFCELLESWGLHPVPNIGAHYQVADSDKPFGILMRQLGIARPDDVPRGDTKPIKTDWFRPKKEKGRSSLTKWSCGCQNVRVGTKEFHACCTRCGNVFTRATESNTVYQSADLVPPNGKEPPKEETPEDNDIPYSDPEDETDQRDIDIALGKYENPWEYEPDDLYPGII